MEQIAEVQLDELAEIEGFDAEVAGELQERARAWLAENAAKLEAKRKELGVTDEVAGLDGLDAEMLVKLGDKGVKTLDDVADLASDELREIIGGDNLTESKANEIIMAARAHWFAGETTPPAGNAWMRYGPTYGNVHHHRPGRSDRRNAGFGASLSGHGRCAAEG